MSDTLRTGALPLPPRMPREALATAAPPGPCPCALGPDPDCPDHGAALRAWAAEHLPPGAIETTAPPLPPEHPCPDCSRATSDEACRDCTIARTWRAVGVDESTLSLLSGAVADLKLRVSYLIDSPVRSVPDAVARAREALGRVAAGLDAIAPPAPNPLDALLAAGWHIVIAPRTDAGVRVAVTRAGKASISYGPDVHAALADALTCARAIDAEGGA